MSCEICKTNMDQESASNKVLIACALCNRLFHVECLGITSPSSVLGDSFFSLTCSSCSSSATHALSRGRVSWLTATLLALYNLHKGGTVSKEGFFHWRSDICRFVSDNWSSIFGHTVKKKKTWQGSVSSCLSVLLTRLICFFKFGLWFEEFQLNLVQIVSYTTEYTCLTYLLASHQAPDSLLREHRLVTSNAEKNKPTKHESQGGD